MHRHTTDETKSSHFEFSSTFSQFLPYVHWRALREVNSISSYILFNTSSSLPRDDLDVCVDNVFTKSTAVLVRKVFVAHQNLEAKRNLHLHFTSNRISLPASAWEFQRRTNTHMPEDDWKTDEFNRRDTPHHSPSHSLCGSWRSCGESVFSGNTYRWTSINMWKECFQEFISFFLEFFLEVFISNSISSVYTRNYDIILILLYTFFCRHPSQTALISRAYLLRTWMWYFRIENIW